MEIAPSEPPVLHLEQLAAEVAELVEACRGEISERGVRRIDRTQLGVLLERWSRAGLDPGLLAYVILACEWLFRARCATGQDVRRTLEQLEAGLCNPLRGPLEADQAALLIEGLRPVLERQLRGRRFLVSLGLWAVGRFSKWQAWATGTRGREGIVRPALQVRKKRGGRIPTLAPIVAGCVAEALAREDAGPESAEPLGLAVTEVLLRRMVPAGEYRRWGRNLDRVVENEPPAESGAAPPMTARQWLTRRSAFGYGMLCPRLAGTTLPQECRHDPRQAFDVLGNSELVAILYSLSWASERNPARAGAS